MDSGRKRERYNAHFSISQKRDHLERRGSPAQLLFELCQDSLAACQWGERLGIGLSTIGHKRTNVRMITPSHLWYAPRTETGDRLRVIVADSRGSSQGHKRARLTSKVKNNIWCLRQRVGRTQEKGLRRHPVDPIMHTNTSPIGILMLVA